MSDKYEKAAQSLEHAREQLRMASNAGRNGRPSRERERQLANALRAAAQAVEEER